ncbi:MAG: nuclear transport factor 2 family protein [Acidobacteria bacterium]|nr:nuclear transport factor 2 family protein [Acidobacteriota bacterium]
MTRSEIQTLVERFVSAWAAKDLDALIACYDEHTELISPLLHTVRGIEAIERSHQDLFLSLVGRVLSDPPDPGAASVRRVRTASAKATAVRRSVPRRRKDPAYRSLMSRRPACAAFS